jgi:hypothetical protein
MGVMNAFVSVPCCVVQRSMPYVFSRPCLSPQTVGLGRGFPQLNGTVLAAGSVELSVRRECAGPYGTVVTLACFCRFVSKFSL